MTTEIVMENIKTFTSYPDKDFYDMMDPIDVFMEQVHEDRECIIYEMAWFYAQIYKLRAELDECPVCRGTATKSYFCRCSKMRFICDDCERKLSDCPFCRRRIVGLYTIGGETHNIVLSDESEL